MDKRFWAVIGIVVLIFGGIFYATNRSNSKGAAIEAPPTNHVKGPREARVILTEYGDFQCPVCAGYFPVVEAVTAKYGDQVAFRYRHLPLTSIHRNAFAAARAAEAAGRQGKFWPMYELLFRNQPAWRDATGNQQFETYARRLGLDMNRFAQDLDSAAVNAAINADKREADRLKLTSTPSFFINGNRVSLPELTDDTTKQPTVAAFSAVLERALRQAGVEPAPKTDDTTAPQSVTQ